MKKTKKKKKTTKVSLAKKEKLSLKAKKRNVFGRKLKKLRKKGVLPANLYGKKIKSQALQVSEKDFLDIYKKVGETGIIELLIGKAAKPHYVLVNNFQVHPVSAVSLHADFRKIDLKEKVQVEIPIELIGQAPAENKGGVLVHLLNEIEIKALPADLPDKFEIDIGVLKEIGQSVSVKDIKVDKKKIEILAEPNQMVVKIEEPRKEEEEKQAEEETEEKEKESGEKEKPKEGKETKEEEKKPEEENKETKKDLS